MKRRMGIVAAAVPLLGLVTGTASAFAFSNRYGIDYTGGSDLENAVQRVDWINDLEPRGGSGGDTRGSGNFTDSDSIRWEDGYYMEQNDPQKCYQTKYVAVNSTMNSIDDLSYDIIGTDGYKIEVEIDSIVLDDIQLDDGKALAVNLGINTGSIQANSKIYSDNTCNTVKEEIVKYDGGLLLVGTRINLIKPTTSDVILDKMYFELTDVDQGQSYKILNNNSKMKAGKMYAAQDAVIQNVEAGATTKNKFSTSDATHTYNSYIYSEVDEASCGAGSIYHNCGFDVNGETRNSIYTPVSGADLEDGLDVVFGFASARSAASGIYFYQGTYNVTYVSDENGRITGIGDEGVTPGKNPAGSTSRANDGYVFQKWIADVDVTLKDGTEIRAGQPLTAEQIKNVVVKSDIRFTAIHVAEDTPVTPDTPTAPDTGGNFITDNGGAGLIACIVLPLSVIAGVAATTAYQGKKNHVRFNK